MTTFLKTAVACLALFASLNASAQVSAADQKLLDATYAKWMELWQSNNADAIGPLLTDNIVQIDPTGTISRGREAVVASYRALFAFWASQPQPDKFDQNIENSQLRYLAPDLVEWSYTEVNTMTFGDKQQVERNSQFVVLRKRGSDFLCELVAVVPVAPGPDMGMNDKK